MGNCCLCEGDGPLLFYCKKFRCDAMNRFTRISTGTYLCEDCFNKFFQEMIMGFEQYGYLKNNSQAFKNLKENADIARRMGIKVIDNEFMFSFHNIFPGGYHINYPSRENYDWYSLYDLFTSEEEYDFQNLEELQNAFNNDEITLVNIINSLSSLLVYENIKNYQNNIPERLKEFSGKVIGLNEREYSDYILDINCYYSKYRNFLETEFKYAYCPTCFRYYGNL